jgi:predicted dehydrogenase
MVHAPQLPNIAVIGAGFISDYHVNGINAAGGANITALVGRNAKKTAARAKALNIPNIVADYRDVLADDAIDAVVIATPDATHKDMAIDALRAGKPVLLQKPMAMNSGECREIMSAADQTGCKLTVSFMHRYFPEITWLKQVLADQRYGAVHFVRLRNATPGADWGDWFYNPANVAGGVVMQLGVHGIDLLQHVFGSISSVQALSKTMNSTRNLADGRTIVTELEDNTLAQYQFAAGFNASHEMSFTEVAGCDRFRMEIYFEKATVWLRTEEGPARVNVDAAIGDPGWQNVDLPDEPLGQAHHSHWLDVVRGAAPVDDTAQAGLSTLVIGEAIYAAAHHRKSIDVGG